MKHFKPEPLFVYKKVQPQQEPGMTGNWRLARNIVKYTNGFVRSEIVASGIPNKPEAQRLARLINRQPRP